jgi:hypothetical protein
MDWIDLGCSRKRQVADSCEHSNELLVSSNVGNFLTSQEQWPMESMM